MAASLVKELERALLLSGIATVHANSIDSAQALVPVRAVQLLQWCRSTSRSQPRFPDSHERAALVLCSATRSRLQLTRCKFDLHLRSSASLIVKSKIWTCYFCTAR